MRGLRILAHILGTIKTSAANMNAHTLKSIIDASERLSELAKDPITGAVDRDNVHFKMSLDLFRHLLCNFELWISSTYKVQFELVGYVYMSLTSTKIDYIDALTPQMLVEGLVLYAKGGSETSYKNTLSINETMEIREVLFSLFINLIKTQPTRREESLQCFVNYLHSETLPVYKTAGLFYLLSLFSSHSEVSKSIIKNTSGKKFVV